MEFRVLNPILQRSIVHSYAGKPKLPCISIVRPRIRIARICPGWGRMSRVCMHRIHIVVAVCTARGGLVNGNIEGFTLASACVTYWEADLLTVLQLSDSIRASLPTPHIKSSPEHIYIHIEVRLGASCRIAKISTWTSTVILRASVFRGAQFDSLRSMIGTETLPYLRLANGLGKNKTQILTCIPEIDSHSPRVTTASIFCRSIFCPRNARQLPHHIH